MSYVDKYISRSQAYNSGLRKDLYVDATKSTIKSLFVDNPSAKKVYLNNSVDPTWVWIVENTKTPSVKKIIMQPDDSIEAGWIVNWNDENWLCTSIDKSKDIYENGFIEKCNTELKWKDETNTIQSFPCVFYFESRTSGIVSDRVMTLPDGRRQVIVQANEHTTKIKSGMRFMFGGSVFKVNDYDAVSTEGIVNLNLESDLFNSATDNLELGIADYYRSNNSEPNDEPDENETPPSSGSFILIKSASTPNEINWNQQKSYYVEYYQDGVLAETQPVTWQLFADDQASNTTLAIITAQDDTSCTVKNNNVTSGYVQLKATLQSDSTVFAWMRIQMKPLF